MYAVPCMYWNPYVTNGTFRSYPSQPQYWNTVQNHAYLNPYYYQQIPYRQEFNMDFGKILV
ncbi:hypothetical protein [Ornithinibacillus xuwenensis]|uniref:Uncharacterized protein n=1 Tax=Ornithinibacillus xuwenensis TaxID=3144668 RepID=A0ABU9XE20_9BACI